MIIGWFIIVVVLWLFWNGIKAKYEKLEQHRSREARNTMWYFMRPPHDDHDHDKHDSD